MLGRRRLTLQIYGVLGKYGHRMNLAKGLMDYRRTFLIKPLIGADLKNSHYVRGLLEDPSLSDGFVDWTCTR